jgi:hypothetical protein
METSGVNPFLRPKRGTRIVVSAKEKRTEDDIVFASQWEKRTYIFLRDNFGRDSFSLQPNFELQPKFQDLSGEKHRGIFYKADFLFGPPRATPSEPLTDTHVVIDAKGMKDAVFSLKRKMFLYRYGGPLHLPSRVKDLEILATLLEEKGFTRTKTNKKNAKKQ